MPPRRETVRLATADRLTIIGFSLAILGALTVTYLGHRDQLVRQEGDIHYIQRSVDDLSTRILAIEQKETR